MGKHEKRAYLDAIRARYRRAKKSGKTNILNEFCAVCGYHRKYALRLLGAPFRRERKPAAKPGPISRYDTPELVEALRAIWLASGQLCSRRLKAAVPLWLPHYDHPLSPETRALLNRISAASIDRLLKPIRATAARKGLSGTKPGTLLKKHIPIQAGTWDVTQPGFMEADTVRSMGGRSPVRRRRSGAG